MARLATCSALLFACASLAGCATIGDHSTYLYMDGASPTEGPAPAHGPTAGPNGWVVTVTPEELAALGMGQQMELDMQARGVVYVVDYWQVEHLDAVMTRTGYGWLPLSLFVAPDKEQGRVVLKAGPPESAPGATSSGPVKPPSPPG